ncbi:S-Ena type endospore appendage [Bacillus sp. UNC41MFS5]|uniref:S-Ena type endospore appendage n=1 Tax=Bacillus sp. UNC41MFS5 TaxID=1449046 RepID=UPI003FA4C759
MLLSDQVSKLEIWRKSIEQDATVTITVFNSARNSAAIQVIVIRTVGTPLQFTVPPGNTISATIDGAESVRVARIGSGITEGKFCLDVCFPVFSDDNN